MKKNSRGISICKGRDTFAGILLEKEFIPRLIMQINSFFSDQRIWGVYQSTKIFLSVTDCYRIQLILPVFSLYMLYCWIQTTHVDFPRYIMYVGIFLHPYIRQVVMTSSGLLTSTYTRISFSILFAQHFVSFVLFVIVRFSSFILVTVFNVDE